MTPLTTPLCLITEVEPDPAIDQVAALVARRTIARVVADPAYLGSAFAEFERRYGVTEIGLARFLECPLRNLARLALAARPDPATSDGRLAVQRIAAMNAADTERLAFVLEE
jgi:hypothetical protein